MTTLRYNTGGQIRNVGPMIQTADFITPDDTKTAAVISSLEVSFNGSTMASPSTSTVSLNSNGTYKVTWDIADTLTMGDMDWQIFTADVLMAYGSIEVVSQDYFDGKFTIALPRVNVEQILTEKLIETVAGRIALNLGFYFNNQGGITSKVVNNVGDLLSILSTALTEATSGRISNNFEFFYRNLDNQTTKIVDNVGSSIITGPVSTVATGGTVIVGTEINDYQATQETGGLRWRTTQSGGPLMTTIMKFVIPVGGEPCKDLRFSMNIDTANNRTVEVAVFDWVAVQYDILQVAVDTNGQLAPIIIANLDSKYTEVGTNAVDVRFQGNNTQNGHFFEIDYAEAIFVADTGSIPSASEIAILTAEVLGYLHGNGIWNGLDAQSGVVVGIDGTQKLVTLDSGPASDDVFNGMFFIASDDTSEDIDGSYIVDYDGTTKIITLHEALAFTVGVGDNYRIIANPPVDVEAFNGELIPETTAGNVATNFGLYFDNDNLAPALARLDKTLLRVDSDVNEGVIQTAVLEMNVDGLTFNDLNNIQLSWVMGKFRFNKTTGNTEYYFQDNTTVIFEIHTELLAGDNITEKTRVSFNPPVAP